MATLLERSLSLNENGGVYFAGTRVNSNPQDAVLFVGLGGSGSDLLLRVKNEVMNRMILPVDAQGNPIGDSPSNIGFLELDTDGRIQTQGYGSATYDEFGGEFCDISVPSVGAVITTAKQKKGAGDPAWDWVDDELNSTAKDGAGGIRQLGRLLLFWNVDRIVAKVRAKITQLATNNPKMTNIKVVVFSGISGGTGSGTFIDMAYILRKLAGEKIPSVSLLGYIIMPDVNELNGGMTAALRTNGYACLKELDYWNSYQEHQIPFVQKYSNNFECKVSDRPFDFCHLLNASDENGNQFSYERILSTVAKNVFSYITGETVDDATGNTAMTQMYSNIGEYIQKMDKECPACYRYLSVGAYSMEIPYTELTTLVAARVFEKLEGSLYRNKPTEDSFRADLGRMQMSPSAITQFLNSGAPGKPLLDTSRYKYDDVWPGTNRPYHDAYNWAAQYQRTVTTQLGNVSSHFEGLYRQYFQAAVSEAGRGPIYVANLIQSNVSHSMINTLEKHRVYCSELSGQCAAKAESIKQKMEMAFQSGARAGIFSKKDALRDYLLAVEEWRWNEEQWFVNDQIAKAISEIVDRLKIYYNNIFKPLRDTLEALPAIFRGNVDKLRVAYAAGTTNEDCKLLLTPMDFEEKHRREFRDAVDTASMEFMKELAGNLKKWVGRDLDDVDTNIAIGVNVPTFISDFIGANFSTLLTINMENLMSTQLSQGETLDHYARTLYDEIEGSARTKFKMAGGLTVATNGFSILSIPKDCPILLKAAVTHLDGRAGIIIKPSEEKGTIYWIKGTSGLPLYASAYIADLEKAYEDSMQEKDKRVGVHLVAAWREELPAIYPECAWRDGYSCARTAGRNKAVREDFAVCVKNGILRLVGDDAILQVASPEVDFSNLQLFGNLLEKKEQLQNLRQRVWWKDGTAKTLYVNGKYKFDAQAKATLASVEENTLRFSDLCALLREQAEKLEHICALEYKLDAPRYFTWANLCGLIRQDPATKHVRLMKAANDPMPELILEGTQVGKYLQYQSYQGFCQKLTETRREELKRQLEALQVAVGSDTEKRKETVARLESMTAKYTEQMNELDGQIARIAKEDSALLLDMRDFYSSVIEVATQLKRDFDGDYDKHDEFI